MKLNSRGLALGLSLAVITRMPDIAIAEGLRNLYTVL